MIRGTATKWRLVLPYIENEIEEIMIMFWQTGNPNLTPPIIKRKNNCEWNESSPNTCYVALRSSETARFSDRYKAKMQISLIPKNGEPVGDKEILITVYPMQDNIIPDGPEFDPEIPTDGEWTYLDGGNIVSD